MKLARYRAPSGTQCGVVIDDGVVSFSSLGLGFSTLDELISGGVEALDGLRDRIRNRRPEHRLIDIELLAPFPKPGKYLAIGMNYGKHVAETRLWGSSKATHQMWFNKQSTCINDPFGIIVPGVSRKLDYEVELGFVIGRRAKYVARQDALSHVFGYFVANDVTARDWQFHSPTFTVGKSFDTHGPIGPWVVTADEISDPQILQLRCLVNGEVRQNANTRDMIYPIADQITYLSAAFTLEPGDLIATGTPEGVGMGMEPPRFLSSGDIVRCEIDGIGAIENRVA